MKTYEDIRAEYITASAIAKKKSSETERLANKARQAALRYQCIAARKMAEYHKLFRKSTYEHLEANWLDSLLRPLLEEIEQRTGWQFANKDDLRTFGLRCECPVRILSDSEDLDEYGERKTKAYIVFTPYGNGLRYDTGKANDRFPLNSIGEINGFNNEVEEVTSVEQIIEFLQLNMESGD